MEFYLFCIYNENFFKSKYKVLIFIISIILLYRFILKEQILFRHKTKFQKRLKKILYFYLFLYKEKLYTFDLYNFKYTSKLSRII